MYNNDLENVGSDGIQIAMADMGVNLVHHNRIVNYAMARNSAHGYGILSGGGSTLRIYNNRIDKGFSPGVQLFGSGVSYVYNNVISNIYYEGINVTDKLLFQPVTGYIYNNTVYNTGSVGLKIYADLTTVGHKVYNNVVVAPGSPWDYPQQGYYIRGSKQILFDFSNNISYRNAKQGLFADSAGRNYHLTSGSTAVNAGRNMQDLGLLTDYDDMARPQDVLFDAGAYEYSGPLATNIPPAANAGKDTVIAAPGTTAILDGSGSADVDGTISVYRWTKLTGPNAGTVVNAGISKTNVTGLTPGTYIFQLLVTDDKGVSDSAKVTVNVLAAANKAPIATAGTDVTVTLPNNTAALSGSNSIDQDGMIVKFEWKKVSGPAAGTISIPDASNTDVSGLVAGVYVFELTVTDNAGATGSDRITITVINPGSNQPPVANAGGDKSIQLPVTTVQLDGSASNDPDGTIVSWQWTKISGPAGGTISSPNQAKTNITALQAGVYIYELTVTDNAGAQSKNRATVTVVPVANKPPVAEAGTDKAIQLPVNTAQLDGSASSDPDGSIVGWQWTKISGAAGGVISNATQAKTDITGLQAGVYVYELTVTDDGGEKATDRVTVTVTAAPNKAPVADAGTDRSVQLPINTVQLDGSTSSDPDGTIASWRWTKVSGPAQGDISNPDRSITQVTGMVAGIYVFELTVTDNGGMTGSDRVTVTVLAAPVNRPPVVRMPAPLTVALPVSNATLDGSASTDPDGSIVRWQWVKISGPAGGDMGTSNVARTTISNLQAGVYIYELTVTDDGGASVSGRVTVTVIAANQPPVANAGGDISINLPTNTAQLDGNTSRDPDGTIVSWQWMKVSGPAAGIIGTPGAAMTQLTGLVAGVYVYELTVTDDGGLTATDRVTVVVLATGGGNRPPVVRAGNNQTILLPVNTAQLDGSGSSDPDGSIVSWMWMKVSGPAGGDLSSPYTARTGINNLQAGTYVYELTVTDNAGASASARVTVVVQPANQPPVANAGSDITIQLPVNTAQLDGSGSTDPDGTIASWRWAKISGPAGGDPTPVNIPKPAISHLQAGTYVYELTITDDGGQTATARMRVIVVAAAVNRDPIAIAGNPVTITLPVNSVRLDGSASYDPDGNVARWAWEKVSGPAGGTIVDRALAQTMVTGLQAGTYVFELTVTDNQGAQGRARVSVQVLSVPANQPPVAQTQGDRTITLPVNFIQADGSRSYDPEGNIVRYSWQQLTGPSPASIWAADRAQTRIASLQAGIYTFELTVTNDKGAKGAATFTVKIQQGDQRPAVSILYPNPARDYIRLNVNHKGNTQMRISIYDLTGKMHYSNKFTADDGLDKLISIETIPVGHYLVEVFGDDKFRWTGHFTKVP
ncbi:PKD domain-containing protein [Chitinophaga sp. MD30]|uniref:PKD domain-containing protein n=1 Tax=Chitinophaga sp. MD30 TaxID=2033437 RepID=UPI000BAE7D9F|nr:PKD domain-containing protein [Chitinophaga sp. MD30]ASZ13135.1 hypothetical protein CK934_20315 [Chitinophaga sp. MD30]